MDNIVISHIRHAAPQYYQVMELRDEILRKPLGLSIKDDDNSRDIIDTIFIAEHNGKVIGCLLVHPLEDNQAQLRAMAVYEEWQGHGIGKKLVLAAEVYIMEQAYSSIILHARKVAMGFYLGLGYTITGDEFTEVGIPHFMMEKSLKDHR